MAEAAKEYTRGSSSPEVFSVAEKYTVLLTWHPEERAYSVTVPSLPGCVTQGKTREEALERAKEAIQCTLDGFHILGMPVPKQDFILAEIEV
ncbi:MAG: type II toxin-antitoxin system HicB family antitoxin [Clostridia bacterium]|nr:MAG: type II toxin-antitoxin system HicB family antitoxin [Clostridia bacterium]